MKRPFTCWNDLASWLESRGMFHMELGLGRIRSGMKLCGVEKPKFLTIQTLGTNGKGSTCAFLAALGQASGRRTGIFTSPHFLSMKERILVDGQGIPESLWLEMANKIFLAYGMEPDLTYFEFLTLLSLLLFEAENVDAAVYEAGLGGLNDATSAIPCDAQCLTPIAMDHAAIIGPTLEDIAGDKAGAIRAEAVFSAPQFPAAMRIIRERCAKTGSRLFVPEKSGARRELGLAGAFQEGNASVAAAAWEWLAKRHGFSTANIEAGLKMAFIPGRMQFIPASPGRPPLVLDGGHNPHALANLARELPELLPGPVQNIIFSCLEDKDWRPGLGMLVRAFPEAGFHILELENSRACPGELMAGELEKLGASSVKLHSGAGALAAILEELAGAKSPALMTGSFYLLALFYSLYPEYLKGNCYVRQSGL